MRAAVSKMSADANATCWTLGGCGEPRHVQHQTHGAGGHRAAAHQPVRSRHLLSRPRLEAEDRPVEEDRLVEAVEGLRQRHVIDLEQRAIGVIAQRFARAVKEDEVREPAAPAVGNRAAHEQRCGVAHRERGELRFPRPQPAVHPLRQQQPRALRGRCRVGALDGDRRHSRHALHVVGNRSLVAVQHHANLAVLP
jgi:hypothetical protein